jgi:hypothetical protein
VNHLRTRGQEGHEGAERGGADREDDGTGRALRECLGHTERLEEAHRALPEEEGRVGDPAEARRDVDDQPHVLEPVAEDGRRPLPVLHAVAGEHHCEHRDQQQRERVAEEDDRERLGGSHGEPGEAADQEESRGDAEADLHGEEVPSAVEPFPTAQRYEVGVDLLPDDVLAQCHAAHPLVSTMTSQTTITALTAIAMA